LKNTILVTVLTILCFVSCKNSTKSGSNSDSESGNRVKVVDDLVNRVCGEGSAERFSFTLDSTFNDFDKGGKEAFKITEGPKITANTLSALTVGLNWYLKHDAKINICWNNLHQNLPEELPDPSDTSIHESDAKYRYYLNYCTFSYTMSVWDWDRWQEELDWMALHGVNLPLQIVGIDAVWYKILTDSKEKGGLGWTHDEANEFIAGPNYQGWFLMNNITKHGGPNPKWWYAHEEKLGKQITDRMRELGMRPCLPGFVGMAPHKYCVDNNLKFSNSGLWNQFVTPDILNVNDAKTKQKFNELANAYYTKQKEVFGFTPTAFSMDPFHEQEVPAQVGGYKPLCEASRDAMNAASADALWVAQEWEENAYQERIDALPCENTILLDLASERKTFFFSGFRHSGLGYGKHPYVFCMLHNYGGRVGMYGCMKMMLDNYKAHRSHPTLQGIGATMEGIETNPVMYDLLFELPWQTNPVGKENINEWLKDYAADRYNLTDDNDKQHADAAWAKLLSSVYNCTNTIQVGCYEPILCGRPTLDNTKTVSAWSRGTQYWDKADVEVAAKELLKVNASNANYIYDLVDVTRQVLVDRAHTIIGELNILNQQGKANSEEFKNKKDEFLKIIDDSDELLSYIPSFTLNQWLSRARKIATDNGGDPDWMEHYARMLITTWAGKVQSDNGQLHDYANREWAGLLKDFYKARWEYFFDHGINSNCDWYTIIESPWVEGKLDNAQYGKYKLSPTPSYDKIRKKVKEIL